MISPGFIPFVRQTILQMKTSKTKTNRRRKSKNVPKRTGQGQAAISECALHYAQAVNNPFEAFERGVASVCVPDQSLVPSLKLVCRSRGYFGTGAAGLGFVAVTVGPMGNDSTTVHSTPAGNTALSTSVLTDAAWGSGGVGGADDSSIGTIPWNQVGLGHATRQMRVVSFGLRARYIGTELNRGGQLFAYRNPSNSTIADQTFDGLLTTNEVKVYPNDREWVTITWTPVVPNDFTYSELVNANWQMMIGVNTDQNMGFEYEVIIYLEAVGTLIAGQTPTDSDVVGFGAGLQVAQRGHYSWLGRGPSWKEIVSQVARAISGASHLISHGARDVRTLYGAAALGTRMLTL
jgi:hypothetical protein